MSKPRTKAAAAPSEAASLETALAEALRSLGDQYPITGRGATEDDVRGETWWNHEVLAETLAAHPAMQPFAGAHERAERLAAALRRLRSASERVWIRRGQVAPERDYAELEAALNAAIEAEAAAPYDEADLFDPDPAYDLMDES